MDPVLVRGVLERNAGTLFGAKNSWIHWLFSQSVIREIKKYHSQMRTSRHGGGVQMAASGSR